MISQDTGRGVGAEVLARDAGTVSVNQFVMLFAGDKFVQDGRVGVDDPGEIHEFAQAQDAVVCQRAFQVPGLQDGARIFEGRCGDTGRDHVFNVESRKAGSLQHIVDALDTSDIGDLMRVGNDGGRSEGNQKAADFLRCDKSGFNMNVGVDQARKSVQPLGVKGFPALIRASARNQAVNESDVGLSDLAQANVDQAAVFDNQVGWFPPGCYVNQVLQCLLIHPVSSPLMPQGLPIYAIS